MSTAVEKVHDTATPAAAALETLERAATRRNRDALGEIREPALARFLARGFPTTREEQWRYTRLDDVAQRTADWLDEPDQPGIDPGRCELPGTLDAARVLIVDGQMAGEVTGLPDGLSVDGLQSLDAREAGELLDLAPEREITPLVMLNTALASELVRVRVESGSAIDRPLYLGLYGSGARIGQQPRIAVRLGCNSQLTLVVHHWSEGASLSNPVFDIRLEPGATLHCIRIQDHSRDALHTEATRVELEADARFELLSLDLGGRLARADTVVELQAAGASAVLNGVFLADDGQHVDQHTRLDHRAPHTQSRERFHGIVNDGGHGVFNGMIMVRPGAEGTDAALTNRNLLLGRKAEINTKPELEIYTDDVRCTHGATTGQLDRNALFYLRSRGITENVAREMLMRSFAHEVIGISDSRGLAATLDALLDRQLARLHIGEPS